MAKDKNNKKRYLRDDQVLINRSPIREVNERILIVCEGLTEVCYFNGLKNHYRLPTVNVILSEDGAAPISVVECAIRKSKDDRDLDLIACVFDHDEHESFSRAINKLNPNKKNKFLVVTSNPCFEIWPLLHFDYTTKAILSVGNKSASDLLISDLQSHFPYKKGDKDLFFKLIESLPTAIKNAKQLTNENAKTKSINPATNVHVLIEKLIKQKIL